MSEHRVITFKTDDASREALEQLQAHEERSRSDVIRRALRFHAEHLGLVRPKAKPRPKRAKGAR